MHDIDWNSLYAKAKDISELPWETVEPDTEIVRLLAEGKILPGKVLDMGCGYGTQSIFLASKGFEVTGFDLSEIALEEARKRALEAGLKIDFQLGNALTVNLQGPFDAVFDRGLFHVIPPEDRESYISRLAGFLKSRGKYHLQVFSENNPGKEGPYRFTVEDVKKLFPGFRLLESREIVHEIRMNAIVEDNKAFMHSLLMENLD